MIGIHKCSLVLAAMSFSLIAITEAVKLDDYDHSNALYEDFSSLETNKHKDGNMRHRLFNKYSLPQSDVHLDKQYHDDVGKPLFLTPLLKDGKIKVTK